MIALRLFAEILDRRESAPILAQANFYDQAAFQKYRTAMKRYHR
jgi:hypothetical protein